MPLYKESDKLKVFSRSFKVNPSGSFALICINYFHDEGTKAFLRNLDRLDHADRVRTILVNNSAKSPDDSTFDHLNLNCLRLDVINAPENLGYFGGAQKALESLQEDKTQTFPEFVIISNTDIHIQDNSFIDRLGSLSLKENCAILAPKIVSELSCKDQNPYMIHRPKKWRMHFYKWIFATPGLNILYPLLAVIKKNIQLYCSKRGQTNATSKQLIQLDKNCREIYAPHGSFMIFTRAYFQFGGTFLHQPFLFGEEITVAEFARNKDLSVLYCPILQVYHEEHVTTGLIPSKKIRNYIAEASRYCADQYF